jgi:pyridoxamine 5'-phosphate oxidase
MSFATNYENALSGIAGGDDPIDLFRVWSEEAAAHETVDHNAMALATTGADGLPDVRIVLLKGFDENGFVFYTNSESRKGVELSENMHAAAALHWKSLGRQVRFRGPVEFVSDAEADEYFRSRHEDSRIGAWASGQSRPLADRGELEQAVEQVRARFRGQEIPRPPHWRGYRVKPVYLEFWLGQPFRLHDRLVFVREKPEADWSSGRLQP